MTLRLLLRMSQLARNPPGSRRVRLYALVIAVSLLIAGIEWLGLWPAWLTHSPRRY